MTNQRKRLGKALEKKVAVMGDGKVQPLSGQLPEFPADVVLDNVLVECKVRQVTLNAKGTHHVSIDLDWLHKVEEEAKRKDFDVGMVAIRPKGSRRVYALLDLEFLLAALSRNRDA